MHVTKTNQEEITIDNVCEKETGVLVRRTISKVFYLDKYTFLYGKEGFCWRNMLNKVDVNTASITKEKVLKRTLDDEKNKVFYFETAEELLNFLVKEQICS